MTSGLRHAAATLPKLLAAAALVIVVSAFASAPVRSEENANRVIDWSHGDVQETPESCGDFIFENMDDKSSYSLIVMGRDGGLCTFAQDGLTFHTLPGNGVATTGVMSAFTFLRSGKNVFVNAVYGF